VFRLIRHRYFFRQRLINRLGLLAPSNESISLRRIYLLWLQISEFVMKFNSSTLMSLRVRVFATGQVSEALCWDPIGLPPFS